jgi:hypothetical protein
LPLARIATLGPEGTLLDVLPTPTPTATPYHVPANLDHIPVKKIELDFRRVSPADTLQGAGSGTSEHAFIVISRTDGFKQVLSLDPVPESDALSGTAQGMLSPATSRKRPLAQLARSSSRSRIPSSDRRRDARALGASSRVCGRTSGDEIARRGDPIARAL